MLFLVLTLRCNNAFSTNLIVFAHFSMPTCLCPLVFALQPLWAHERWMTSFLEYIVNGTLLSSPPAVAGMKIGTIAFLVEVVVAFGID